MAIERTLSIVKPDAVAKNHIGVIFAQFLKAKTLFLLTVTSLVRRILKKLLLVLSVQISL